MTSLRLKKGDQVKVINGKDRDRIGKILRVYPDKSKVLVERINMAKRHTRPNPNKSIKGGIVPKEAPIHISNLMLVCPQCQKPTRVGYSFLQNGKKVRTCKISGDILDQD
ncbi:MAG: 50S ribosomal protein L24 [Acidobacteria bacterium]|nr:50S ribosomal protein L24 [Acidobacteriota bacterium]MBI3657628.1 50S ribosomal protein L24 [Acidobacteriota bacterium]